MKRQPDRDTQAIFLRINRELKAALQDILQKEQKTLRQWMHEQAEDYVKRHGAGNPAVPLQKWVENPQYVACPTILEAEGFNWDSFNQEDLGQFLTILSREIERISHIRLQRRQTK